MNGHDISYKLKNGTVLLYPKEKRTVSADGRVIGYVAEDGQFLPNSTHIPPGHSTTSVAGLAPEVVSTISVTPNSDTSITKRVEDTVGPSQPSGFRLYCVQGWGYCVQYPYYYHCDQTWGNKDAAVDNISCDTYCKCFSLTFGCYVVTLDNHTWVCEGYYSAYLVTVHEMAADGSMMPNGTVIGYIDEHGTAIINDKSLLSA